MLCVSVCGLLLQSEAEVTSAALDLVLGLQVVHALGGDAVDGQNHVSHGDATFGCFTAIRQLHRHLNKNKLTARPASVWRIGWVKVM